MLTGLLVRVAGPADFAAVARLTVAAYAEDGQLEGEHGYGAVLADVAGRAERGTVLVAVDAACDEVLGSVTFVVAGTRDAQVAGPGEAEFRMLAVDPAAQGRGVGAVLVQECLNRAVAGGSSALVICVRSGFADSAQRLYRGFGFVRWPEKDWSPLPGVDLLALRLDLTT